MCFFIGIEDVAANAMIHLIQKNRTDRFISYSELEEYGTQVVNILNTTRFKAVLLFSRENKYAFFRNYSDFFQEDCDQNGLLGIKLKENITEEQLIKKFHGYLDFSLLKAFYNAEAVKVLGLPN